jgi:tetratricopeptide (TPR) repeat protein
MGYLRARRSIKLGSGVKLNLTKRGASVSLGGRGAHYTVSTTGRHTRTVGIPGTGLSYVDTHGGRGGSRGPARTTQAPPATVAAAKPKRPGLFASATEKRFARGIAAYAAGRPVDALALFREASERDGDNRTSADDLMCGLVLLTVDEDAGAAATHLERVVASDNPLPDKLISTYAPGLRFVVEVSNGVRIVAAATSVLAVEMLARAYHQLGRTDEAIGLIQKLHDVDPADPWVILQLCMYHAKEREWDEIVHVAAQVTNADDLTCSIVNARAEALIELGLNDAAYEASKDALRSKKRLPGVLHEARYLRARALQHLGRLAMARKELEKLYAEAPDYEDVQALLRDPEWGAPATGA